MFKSRVGRSKCVPQVLESQIGRKQGSIPSTAKGLRVFDLFRGSQIFLDLLQTSALPGGESLRFRLFFLASLATLGGLLGLISGNFKALRWLDGSLALGCLVRLTFQRSWRIRLLVRKHD